MHGFCVVTSGNGEKRLRGVHCCVAAAGDPLGISLSPSSCLSPGRVTLWLCAYIWQLEASDPDVLPVCVGMLLPGQAPGSPVLSAQGAENQSGCQAKEGLFQSGVQHLQH